MKKGSIGTLAFLIAVSCMTSVRADNAWDPGSTHLALEGGLAAGGDKLATVVDTSGGTHSIYAGDAIYTDVGVQHNFGDSSWSLRATGGFSFTGVTASNANVTFAYVPVNLLAIYSVDNGHFGAGLTYHLGPRLDMDGFAPNVNFQSAPGLILQYQFWLFGVRYTAIRYKISSFSTGGSCIANCTFSGNSLGLFFNYVF